MSSNIEKNNMYLVSESTSQGLTHEEIRSLIEARDKYIELLKSYVDKGGSKYWLKTQGFINLEIYLPPKKQVRPVYTSSKLVDLVVERIKDQFSNFTDKALDYVLFNGIKYVYHYDSVKSPRRTSVRLSYKVNTGIEKIRNNIHITISALINSVILDRIEREYSSYYNEALSCFVNPRKVEYY